MIGGYAIEEADALTEVVNIAMGTAADSLARVLNTFVRLPVPTIRLVQSHSVVRTIADITGTTTKLTAVRQAYTSALRGEALVIFGPNAATDLAQCVGYPAQPTRGETEEILLEVSNIIVGACLGGIAQQLSHDLVFSAPSMMGHDVCIDELLEPRRLTWDQSLLVEANFRLEEKDFVAHILIFWPEASINAVRAAIARLLAS